MVQVYNFLGSWQLFPEKGTYEGSPRPKSGIYKIEAMDNSKELTISSNWVTLENEAFASQYKIRADGSLRPFEDTQLADQVRASVTDSITFTLHFYKSGQVVLQVVHEITPNGYLKITQQGVRPGGAAYTNTEIYHRQRSVLPYAASVAGALVKPTEVGVIKHKALTAMEEQTNLQLEQIRQQIELLALQAQEIHKRKELSLLIYNAQLPFKPEIGQTYYLYEKKGGQPVLSLISPQEWGASLPYHRFVAAVKLMADHTWIEL